MGDQVVATTQVISFGRERISGQWYVVMKIHGQGHLKFPPDIAHSIARELIGECNMIDKLDGNVIRVPWKR